MKSDHIDCPASGPELPARPGARRRAGRQSGAEVFEFTLAFLPFLAMLLVLLDTAWAVYVKSTLEQAVRIGVRTGITMTAANTPTGSCLTDYVKGVVQQNASGLLAGSSGVGLIKVNYFLPPAENSTGPATDVSTQANADAPGNIMQVSVQNYSLIPLLPRIYSWNQVQDTSPLVMSVYSADLMEPSSSPPCVGVAP
ncbi:MAG TPA: TadE/TadG family type IV pilus assembly protein [Bryobacteraceae bacterium]|nr:TadE/TadG family type IV pilus assembly protein [Bryobacteraceae bacterium]